MHCVHHATQIQTHTTNAHPHKVRDSASAADVCNALHWTCTAGGVECSEQEKDCQGSSLSLVANANRAFSLYFEAQEYASHACDFGGVAKDNRFTSGGGGEEEGSATWVPIWADEFDGDSIDSEKWGYNLHHFFFFFFNTYLYTFKKTLPPLIFI